MSNDSHRAAVAEALLSLVTAPDRAVGIAGDLVEAGDARGAWRFWLDLSSIALTLFSRGVREAPWRFSGFFVAGFILWFAIYALLRIIGAAAGLQPLDVRLLDCAVLPMTTFAYLAITLALSNFLAGAALSLGSRTVRGLDGCAPLAMFWAASALVLPVLESLSPTGSSYCTALYLIALPLLYVAPLLYGGALVRRRLAEY